MKRDLLNIAALVAGVLVLAVGGPLLVGQVRSLPPRTLTARADQRVADAAGEAEGKPRPAKATPREAKAMCAKENCPT